MDTDQTRNGQQRFPSHAPPESAGVRISENLDAPAVCTKPDVAVESTGGCFVRRKIGQAVPKVRSSQMNTVVAKKDAVSVGLISRSVIVGKLGWSDVDASAEMGVLRTQVLACPRRNGRAEPHREEIDVGPANARRSSGHGAVDIERDMPPNGRHALDGSQEDGLERGRRVVLASARDDHAVHTHAFERVVASRRPKRRMKRRQGQRGLSGHPRHAGIHRCACRSAPPCICGPMTLR